MRSAVRLIPAFLLLAGTAAAASPPLFGPLFQRTDIEPLLGGVSGGEATSFAFADLDGDGTLDLVASVNRGYDDGEGDSYLTVLLNQGHGVLAPPEQIPTPFGWETCAVATPDLDADGLPDIVAANSGADTISVYFNLGDASFADPVDHPVGEEPRSLVAADLDADGNTDLAVLNTESDDLSALLNEGAGALAPEIRSPVPGGVADNDGGDVSPSPGPMMDAADFDADGRLDLVVPGPVSPVCLLGDGAGGFAASASQPDMLGYDIVAADLDGDGDADLASIDNYTNEYVYVVLNEGGGAWGELATYSANHLDGCNVPCDSFTSIAAGDADADGDLDLVFGGNARPNVGLLPNHGDGTFGETESIPSFHESWIVEFADLSGDGVEDLVIGGRRVRSGVRVYPISRGGGLVTPLLVSGLDLPNTGGSRHIAAADLDLDGDPDATGVHYQEDRIQLFAGVGDGSFTFPSPVPVAHDEEIALERIAIADLDADGLPDLIAADTGVPGGGSLPGRLWIAHNEGGMSFGTPVPTELGGRYPKDLAIADLDDDGDRDVVVWAADTWVGKGIPLDRWVLVFANDGDGGLALAEEVPIASLVFAGPQRSAVAVADFDDDGDTDVAATAGPFEAPGFVAILHNDGTGSLAVAQQVDVAPHPDALVAADLDGDGDSDLAVNHNHNASTGILDLSDPYMTVLHNDGNGVFAIGDEHSSTGVIGDASIAVADMNGDGAIDIVTPDVVANVGVHLNRGDGTFDPIEAYATLDHVRGIALEDFNGDGRADIVTGNFSFDGLTFLPNLAPVACPADRNADGALNILDFVAFQQAFLAGEDSADCDGDGRLTNPGDFVCYRRLFMAGCE